MKDKRVCGNCEFWKMGIPCGSCNLKPFLKTNDEMVFEDATGRCPLENNDNEYCTNEELEEIIQDMKIRERKENANDKMCKWLNGL